MNPLNDIPEINIADPIHPSFEIIRLITNKD